MYLYITINTQKEYLNICVDWERGKKYYGNRNLLIVDEEIDVVYNSFSVLMLNDITLIEDKYLSGCTEAQNVYRAIVEKLKDYLVKNIRQMQRIEVNHDKKQLNWIGNPFLDKITPNKKLLSLQFLTC